MTDCSLLLHSITPKCSTASINGFLPDKSRCTVLNWEWGRGMGGLMSPPCLDCLFIASILFWISFQLKRKRQTAQGKHEHTCPRPPECKSHRANQKTHNTQARLRQIQYIQLNKLRHESGNLVFLKKKNV